MGRYSARLRALEAKLVLPERPQRPFVVWMITDADDPPVWAEQAIRPYMPTDGRGSSRELSVKSSKCASCSG